nr:MAG TPA: hypothetical protein [Caudoviricetes sp.]
MKTLLIDEKGVMYWASLTDIRDLRAGIRRPSTVLPSLERAEGTNVSTEEWERREYLGFLCNTYANGRKFKEKKVMKGGRFVSAYRYLQRLFGFRTDVAAMVRGHKYIIPIADAVEYTLGLVNAAGLIRRIRMREPALHNIDHYGVTNFLIAD